MKISEELWTSSRDKWLAIIAALNTEDMDSEPLGLSCGYCDAFIIPWKSRLEGEEECHACPLFQRGVCRNECADNLPYWIVSRKNWNGHNRSMLLENAEKILNAILEDAP